MTFKNYYKVLGLKDYASLVEIKKAYRTMAFRYHPDHEKGGKSSAERFQEIKEAYQVLMDPIKKRHFDAQLKAANIYAPSYSFGKYSVPPKHTNIEEEKNPKSSVSKSSWKEVLKPIILIIITIGLMFLIMKPPSWITKYFSGKQQIEYPKIK
jgi:curved DNA-binding protein CbpA